MRDLNIALALIGGLTLLLSLTAGLFKSKVYLLSEPMVATFLGILIGPLVWDVLALERWADPQALLEQVARLTVALAVMGAALRLPRKYFQQHARSMAVLLGPGMLLMWIVSGLLIYWLLAWPFWVAMLAGAVVTPTDPVISGALVTGETAKKDIPARLRHSLSAESGANDGGAYPFVFLSILMLQHPPGEALAEWLTRTLLWEVLAAVAAGFAVGYAAGRVQRWSESRDYMEETSLLTLTVALTGVVLGATKLMGTDGILAVFAAGLAFNHVVGRQEEAEMANLQEAGTRLFTFPVFVFFGMALPWADWVELGWTGVAVAALILLLRRLPMTFALQPLLRPLQKMADALLYGWFGPIGIAALFYATLSVRETGEERVWVVGSLVIFSSILAHGMTATPFTKLYGRAEKLSAADAAQQGNKHAP